jgi:hypothetical protein
MRALALTLVAAGCSADLPPSDRVDKLRLLAVRAEPPEVQPGQASALDTLTVYPGGFDGGGPQVSFLWLACLEAVGAQAPTACGVSAQGNGGAGTFDADGGAPPDCAAQPDAALCLIGAGETARYTPTAAALGGGAVGEVILTVIAADEQAGGAAGCAITASQNGGAPADPDHCVIALKRLTVSTSATPNGNPTLPLLALGGLSLADGSAHWSAGGAAQDVTAVRGPGSDERKGDGTFETLTLAWFATAGSFDTSRSGFQPADCDPACMMTEPPVTVDAHWTPPNSDDAARYAPTGTVQFWAVLRDDRGGVAWQSGTAE